jgi:hypothetical protein
MVTRTTIAMLVLLALALAAGAVAVQSRTVTGPVYAVAQLQAGFARHPRTWIGRSVLVRGNVRRVAVTMCSSRGCQPQVQEWLVMETPPVFRSGGHVWISQGPPRGLVLAPGPTVRLIDALAHLPLVGRYLRDRLRPCRAAAAMSRTTASWDMGGTDGLLRAVSPAGQLLWRSRFQHGQQHLLDDRPRRPGAAR